MKVGVVGVGKLGGTLAFALARESIFGELVLCDAVTDLAKAQADDIRHGLGESLRTQVQAGSLADLGDAAIVIIAAGQGRKPGMTRLDLLHANAGVIASLAREIGRVAPGASLVILTNPVDVLTAVAQRSSGLDRHRVVGSGALLDSMRFRDILAERFRVARSEVNAAVLGEHGDRLVAVFSRAQIRDLPVDLTPDGKVEILNALRAAAERILESKGGTVFGPAGCTVALVKALVSPTPSRLPVSLVLDGEYMVRGIALGVPAILGQGRVLGVEEWPLSPDERALFDLAAKALGPFVAQALGALGSAIDASTMSKPAAFPGS